MAETVPTLELPPVCPFTCQVTAESVVLATLAVKDSVAPQRMVPPAGVTVTETAGPAGFKTGIDTPVWELTPAMVARIG